jgi:hypothetical protein
VGNSHLKGQLGTACQHGQDLVGVDGAHHLLSSLTEEIGDKPLVAGLTRDQVSDGEGDDGSSAKDNKKDLFHDKLHSIGTKASTN